MRPFPAVLVLVLLSCSTVPVAPRDPPSTDVTADTPDGLWVLQIRRQAWKPRDLEFVLRIDSTGADVHGTATLDPVFIGRTTASLFDWTADGDTVRFSLHSRMDDLVYRFEGRREGGTLDGRVTWNDQTEPFSGFRREVRRFDIDIERFPVALDPRDVGVDPVLLDRLVLGAETARSDGLLVLSDGRLVAARTFGGEDTASSVGSLSSTLATLAGGETDGLRPSELAALGQAVVDGTWTSAPEGWMDVLVARAADPVAPFDGWSVQPDPLDVTLPPLGFGVVTAAGEGLLVYPEARLVVVRTARRGESRYDRRYDDRDQMEWVDQMAETIALEKLGRPPIER